LWEEHLFRLGSILRRTDPIKQKFDNFKEPYFLINLLFSSLLDADSMNVANLVPERDEVRTDAVTSYLKTKKNDDDHDNINRLRKMLYRHVEQKVDEQDLIQRIFTLTAPTGLGKTLTSINFALKMRDKIRRKNGFVPRLIYVAPFIAILDQNMKVLQQVFDTNQQTKILLMHHHLARNKIIETRNQMEQYMIGVSPQDIKASNLEEFHGIYKINNSDIGILYKEITGFVK
jgi:CRISPR/Cas system-associated endonuclease/helicase Cas3